MKQRKVIMTAMLCLLLCSCGAQQTTQQEQVEVGIQENNLEESIDEKVYELNYITIPDADEAFGERYILLNGLAGENIYRLVENYPEAGNYEVVEYYVQILKPPYTEWMMYPVDMPEYVQEADCYVRDAYITEEGIMKLLFESSERIYLGEWTETDGFGAKELPVHIELEAIFDNSWYGRWYDSEEQGIFLLNEEIALRYDKNGEEQTTALQKAGGLIFQITENPFSGELSDSWSMKEGGMRIEDGGFSIWTADSEEPVFVARNDSDTKRNEYSCFLVGDEGRVAFASETEGYLCNKIGIYQFSMEDQSRKQIFNFSDAGMGPETMTLRQMDMSVREDGTLLVVCDYADGRRWFAELVEQTVANQGDKKLLELAVVMEDSYLKKAIVDFNKQSDEYEIVLRTCSEEENPDDFRSRIHAELSSGEGPDILANTVLDIRAGAEKSYLLDLTEYYAAYQDIFFPTVTQLGKVDDKYYGIPYSFNVMTLVADKKVVGERQSWSLEEMLQYMEQGDTDTLISQMDEAYTFFYLGLITEDSKLIDWENSVSHLDGKEACELLEFVTQHSQRDAEVESSATEQLAKGESLTEVIYLMTPSMAQYVSGYLQGDEVYIGFPTDNNTSGHCLTGSVLGVNRNSPSVEGAIEFVEYLLSDEQQSYLAEMMLNGRAGYPVQNEILEQSFDKLYEEAEAEKQETYDDGVEALTAKQCEALWHMLENAHLYQHDTEVVLDIIIEESKAYRTGAKTAQQVLDIVHNRVQLYLDESQ